MGLPGPELTDGLRGLIERVQPGGFIFFTRNLASPEQVFSLIQEVRGLLDHPPIITIDQEGGRVSRLKVIGAEPISGYELAVHGSEEDCRRHGELMGKALSLLGFNLNLAPVIDFSIDERMDNSLRGRCLGRSPEEVICKAGAFLEGMESEGVLGTVKHFPGYTYCQMDPHGDLPKIERSKKEMEQSELLTFRAFAKKASAIMVGHGHFTSWHEEPLPASLSPEILKFLREDVGFDGLVMTDDLEMGAIANLYGSRESARRAIEAGEDMLLICHNPACTEVSFDALKEMSEERCSRALRAVQDFQTKLAVPPETFDDVAYREVNDQIIKLRERLTDE